MKKLRPATALLLLLTVMSITLLPKPFHLSDVNAQVSPVARLEVWNDQYGANITDTVLTSGTEFTVKVNITGAGPIQGFDVTMRYYNLTIAPAVLGAVILNATTSKADLTGALIDPSNPPPGCTVFEVRNEVDAPWGAIRVLAALLGGGCTVDGTGTLFSVTFRVVGEGVAAIDIIPTDNTGKAATQITTLLPGEEPKLVPYEAFGGYFRNRAGIAPVANFDMNPASPGLGDTVLFDGSLSSDPSNSTGPDKGIRKWTWNFGDGTANVIGTIVSHIFIAPPVAPTSGNFTMRLIVLDYDNGLANRNTTVVHVRLNTIHDVAMSVTTSVNQLTAGQTLGVTVRVNNNGNRNELANVTVTYSYQGDTLIAREPLVNITIFSRLRTYNYQLNTAGLPARQYTVKAVGIIVNATTGQPVPDNKPLDNESSVAFNVLAAEQSSALPIIYVAAGVVVALVAAWVVLRVVRRKKEET